MSEPHETANPHAGHAHGSLIHRMVHVTLGQPLLVMTTALVSAWSAFGRSTGYRWTRIPISLPRWWRSLRSGPAMPPRKWNG